MIDQHNRDHSSLLSRRHSARCTILFLQRMWIVLLFVLFSLIFTLSFIGTASNTLPGNNTRNFNLLNVFPNPFQRQQQQSPKSLSPSKQSSSGLSDETSQDRAYYNISSPYNNIIADCALVSLGVRYNDDKFTNHQYQNLYCEVLRDFQRSQRKIRMLEIGFGCGHNVNTPNQQGVSALIWKEYFGGSNSISSSSSSSSSSTSSTSSIISSSGISSSSGNSSSSSNSSYSGNSSKSNSGSSYSNNPPSSSSGIDLYEVDLKSPAHLACVNKYLASHSSDIVQAIYLGDQSNKPFLTEVGDATDPGQKPTLTPYL